MSVDNISVEITSDNQITVTVLDETGHYGLTKLNTKEALSIAAMIVSLVRYCGQSNIEDAIALAFSTADAAIKPPAYDPSRRVPSVGVEEVPGEPRTLRYYMIPDTDSGSVEGI